MVADDKSGGNEDAGNGANANEAKPRAAAKPRKGSLLWCWVHVRPFLAPLLFVVFLACAAWLLRKLVLDVDELTYQCAVTYSAGAVGALLLSILSLLITAEGRLSVYPRGSKHRCDYCPSESAAIVCKDCGQVQWHTLRELRRIGLVSAAFISTYRWQLVASVLPFIAVELISIGVKVNQHENAVKDANLTHARAAAEAGSNFRGALLLAEALCKDPRDEACVKELDTLRDNYFRYSREAPSVIFQLVALCEKNAKAASATEKAAASGSEPVCQAGAPAVAATAIGGSANAGPPSPGQDEAGATLRTMCKLADATTNGRSYDHLIDALNRDFRAYVNLVATCSNGKPQCTEHRRKVAKALYENGRLVQCMIAEVAYNIEYYGDTKPFRTYEKCADPCTKWSELPDGSSAELDWANWTTPEIQNGAPPVP